jgi:hypothetical protein
MPNDWLSRGVFVIISVVIVLLVGGGIVLYAATVPSTTPETPTPTNENVPDNVSQSDFPAGFGPNGIAHVRAVDEHRAALASVSSYSFTHETESNGTLTAERNLTSNGTTVQGTHLIQTGSTTTVYPIETRNGTVIRQNVADAPPDIRPVVASTFTNGIDTITTGFEMGDFRVSHIVFTEDGDVSYFIYRLVDDSDPRIRASFYVRPDGLIAYGNISYQDETGTFISEQYLILTQ